jgi:hypothetical protein
MYILRPRVIGVNELGEIRRCIGCRVARSSAFDRGRTKESRCLWEIGRKWRAMIPMHMTRLDPSHMQMIPKNDLLYVLWFDALCRDDFGEGFRGGMRVKKFEKLFCLRRVDTNILNLALKWDGHTLAMPTSKKTFLPRPLCSIKKA